MKRLGSIETAGLSTGKRRAIRLIERDVQEHSDTIEFMKALTMLAWNQGKLGDHEKSKKLFAQVLQQKLKGAEADQLKQDA